MRINNTLEDVKNIVESLGYILISETYQNCYDKLILLDKDGYGYYPTFKSISSGCVPLPFHKSNPYTIQNIKLWIGLNKKNFNLISDDYHGNNQKMNFKCLVDGCGEVFKSDWASIYSGGGCAVCSGRQVVLSNCLATKNPELSLEWSLTKNGELTPYDVSSGSGKTVWWICKHGHEWKASICNRNKGQGCPYCCNKKFCVDNSLAIMEPDIAKQWHPEKNKGITPYDIICGTNKKFWWKCEFEHSWEASINMRSMQNTGCPYCSGRYATVENNLLTVSPDVCLEWNYNKNKTNPDNYTPSSNKKVWWICGKCNHEWETSINHRSSGKGCPFCAGNMVKVGINDMWTTNPNLAKMLLNKNHGYLYSQNSNKAVDWVCTNCSNVIENKIINSVNKQGLSCPKCSDGISYPNKFTFNLLQQLNIKFVNEYSPDWIKPKRYDFYFECKGVKYILEIDGALGHGNEGKWMDSDTGLKVDAQKQNLAELHGYVVIRINVLKSSIEYIKNNILNSELANILELNNINWLDCHTYACSSFVKKACDLWDSGIYNAKEIGKTMGLNRATVLNYLKKGFTIDKYQTKVEGANGFKRRPIVQLHLEDRRLVAKWDNIADACRYHNLNYQQISRYCKNKNKSLGGYYWMYMEDYNKAECD